MRPDRLDAATRAMAGVAAPWEARLQAIKNIAATAHRNTRRPAPRRTETDHLEAISGHPVRCGHSWARSRAVPMTLLDALAVTTALPVLRELGGVFDVVVMAAVFIRSGVYTSASTFATGFRAAL